MIILRTRFPMSFPFMTVIKPYFEKTNSYEFGLKCGYERRKLDHWTFQCKKTKKSRQCEYTKWLLKKEKKTKN